jgi:predicted O-methyltransferase YrrM
MGLATVLGLARQGFFIPYRYARTVKPQSYAALEPLFQAAEPSFVSILEDIARHATRLAEFDGRNGTPRLDQDWFPRLDAAAAYALVKRERPARIVEVGSGHSTRFLAQAVRDHRLATAITCIDPAPRASVQALKVEHLPVVLAQADPAVIGALGAGDILFIDSSHIAMPGTDVDRLFLDVLPRLPSGTLVHVHDMLLPDAYPAEGEWRGYNEQIVVGALLQGGGYEIVFSSRYAATRMAASLGAAADLPLRAGVVESSLWLRKR